MLRRVPIPLEHAARIELLGERNEFVRGLRSFRKRGRIGNLQMQRRDMCVQEITAIERACDCGESFHLRTEVDGHAVAHTKFAIDFIERTRTPFLKVAAVAAGLQEQDCANEYAGCPTRNAIARLVTEGETPAIWNNETSLKRVWGKTQTNRSRDALRARVQLHHHDHEKRFAPGKRMIPKSGVRFADDGLDPVAHADGPRIKQNG
jgi:hypothetical protein